jgi:hypothetical protein
LFQELLGPILELELAAEKYPDCKPMLVPEGVTFSIQHLLTVPIITDEVNEEMENTCNSDHDIIKVTKTDGHFSMAIIDSQGPVTASYLSTDKFQGQSLCYITTITRKAACKHSSLKNFIVTQRKGACPHDQVEGILSLFCYCEAAEGRFQSLIEKQEHEATPALMEHLIEKSSDFNYSISIRQNNTVKKILTKVSHLQLCQYNGVLKLSSIKPAFDCTCKWMACHAFQAIHFMVTSLDANGKTLDVRKDAHALKCDGNCSTTKTDMYGSLQNKRTNKIEQPANETEACKEKTKMDCLRDILIEEMIKPRRGIGMFNINCVADNRVFW